MPDEPDVVVKTIVAGKPTETPQLPFLAVTESDDPEDWEPTEAGLAFVAMVVEREEQLTNGQLCGYLFEWTLAISTIAETSGQDASQAMDALVSLQEAGLIKLRAGGIELLDPDGNHAGALGLDTLADIWEELHP